MSGLGAGRYDLDAVRAANPIDKIAGRHVQWDARKSNYRKGDLWACCPLHEEKTPSFHVDVQSGLWHCFGCDRGGTVFDYVQEKDGLSFIEAVKLLAGDANIAPTQEDKDVRAAKDAERAAKRKQREAEDRARELTARDEALRWWHESVPDHPLLDAYLRARGVNVDALRAARGGLPPVLRVHPSLPYLEKDGDRGREVHRGPAMVAAAGRFVIVGVHRTWITAEGRQKVDGRKLDKRMRGPLFGHPVRFMPPTAKMIVGEGIETTLAVWSALLARGGAGWSADAALSLDALAGGGDRDGAGPASRMTGKRLPSAQPDWASPGWEAPTLVDRLVILAEGSEKDPEKAERMTLRALRRHGFRPDGRARECTFRLPGGRWDSGLDFADLAAGAAA